jgi:hypothetical protein
MTDRTPAAVDSSDPTARAARVHEAVRRRYAEAALTAAGGEETACGCRWRSAASRRSQSGRSSSPIVERIAQADVAAR